MPTKQCQRNHFSVRSKAHNQKIITTAFRQVRDKITNESILIDIIVEVIYVGIKDGDFKLWKCAYANNNVSCLREWVRHNLFNHKNLQLKGDYVSRKEELNVVP
jgi:hypothetical protein